MPLRTLILTAVAALSLCAAPMSVMAQSPGAKAAGSVSKQMVKRIVLPVFVVMAVVDSAEAYEQHCQHVPEEDAFACTAEAFTQSQLEEFKTLGYDLAEVWTYVIVPNVVHFWDENGDDIVAGAEWAAEKAADAAIAAGDAIAEHGPSVMDWIGQQFE
ncbi:MAG: hypothetical protein AAGP08_09570 [Pseudomonadota bacterium]